MTRGWTEYFLLQLLSRVNTREQITIPSYLIRRNYRLKVLRAHEVQLMHSSRMGHFLQTVLHFSL